MNITENLKQLLSSSGASIVKIGNTEHIKELDVYKNSIFSKYNYVISIGVKLSDSVVDKLINGPTDEYAHVPIFGKWVLLTLMMIGRLELFTVLVIFTPWFWKN